MPYEYMCHPALASDFWAINWVEGFKNSSSVADSSNVGGAPRHPSVVSLPLRTTMKFGWRPDMPDHRDLHVTFDKKDAPSQIKRKAEGVFVSVSMVVISVFALSKLCLFPSLASSAQEQRRSLTFALRTVASPSSTRDTWAAAQPTLWRPPSTSPCTR